MKFPSNICFCLVAICIYATVLMVLFFTGDWHCAYVLLYGPRILETLEPPSDVV